GWACTHSRCVPACKDDRPEPAHGEATVKLPMASTVWIVRYLWLIPVLPVLAAGIGALLKQSQRRFAATIAICSMSLSFVLAVVAFTHLLLEPARLFVNF